MGCLIEPQELRFSTMKARNSFEHPSGCQPCSPNPAPLSSVSLPANPAEAPQVSPGWKLKLQGLSPSPESPGEAGQDAAPWSFHPRAGWAGAAGQWGWGENQQDNKPTSKTSFIWKLWCLLSSFWAGELSTTCG